MLSFYGINPDLLDTLFFLLWKADETLEKKAVLINAYIEESTTKKKSWKETSVVWPLVDWFSSDTKSVIEYTHLTSNKLDQGSRVSSIITPYFPIFKSQELGIVQI